MVSGEDIYNRLVLILKERNIQFKDFYKDINLSRQTVFKWKAGSMPASDTLYIISKKLNISLEWLISGDVVQPTYEQTSPTQIVNRINKKLQSESDDIGSIDYSKINDIICPYDIPDWFNGRKYPSIDKLIAISNRLEIPFSYLITGNFESANDFNNYNSTNKLSYELINTLNKLSNNQLDYIVKTANLCLLESQYNNNNNDFTNKQNFDSLLNQNK